MNNEYYIPDGPWSEIMEFLLLNKSDFDERLWKERYKRMIPKCLHFTTTEETEKTYKYCKNELNWDIEMYCCKRKGFIVKNSKNDIYHFIIRFVEHFRFG